MRFTIRDLLWLTVVVALGVAWWVDRSRLAAKLEPWERWEQHMNALQDLAPPPNPSAPAPNQPKK